MSEPDPRSFLPLTPLVSEVLLSLAEEPRHGYGIILDVERRSDGVITLRTGTLYLLLQRLVAQKLIEETDAISDDERRRYYRLTEIGRAVLGAEARRLETLVHEARRARVLGRMAKR
jgi:DNA-binding PadR family transcriptional regulator